MRATIIRLIPLLLPAGLASSQTLHLQYPMPSEPALATTADTVYRTVGGNKLEFDLYRPASAASGQPLPVAIFMNGIGSSELRRWPIYKEWGQLVAAQGFAGVTFDTHEGGVSDDFDALMGYLHGHADELRINPDQAILWACSANVTAGLPIAMDPRRSAIKAAVIYYGAGEVKDFRPDLPVLYVRAGLDGVDLNRAIDEIGKRAWEANAPFTLVNLPAAHHAFDARDDNAITRGTIARTLEFMKEHAQPKVQEAISAGVLEASAASAVYRADWQTAVSKYEQLVQRSPKDSEVRRSYGNALLGVGEYGRAVAEYERAVALGNPNLGWISYAAATASMKLGDGERALQWIANLKDIEVMRRRLKGDPVFEPLRNDARFREIADRPD